MSAGLFGLLDDREGFDPQDDVVGRLHHEGDGLRLPRSGILVDALVPAILSQRVTGFEAKRSYRTLVERWGEPAPGPVGLRLTPPAEVPATALDLDPDSAFRLEASRRVDELLGGMFEGPSIQD